MLTKILFYKKSFVESFFYVICECKFLKWFARPVFFRSSISFHPHSLSHTKRGSAPFNCELGRNQKQSENWFPRRFTLETVGFTIPPPQKNATQIHHKLGNIEILIYKQNFCARSAKSVCVCWTPFAKKAPSMFTRKRKKPHVYVDEIDPFLATDD